MAQRLGASERARIEVMVGMGVGQVLKSMLKACTHHV